MKPRLVFLLALATATALLVAGCGGSSSDGAGSDPAAVAPAASPVFIDVAVRPEGELQANVEALAREIAGIDDLGGLIVEQLESGVAPGEGADFDKEIEPWLGEQAGISLQEFDGEDFGGYVVAIASTDTGATQEFIDGNAEDVVREGSYEGTDFKVEDDDTVVGVVGDFLVVAETEKAFKAAVDADSEESLADQDAYTSATDAAPEESLADVFVDVGNMIEESGGQIDPEAQQLLEASGIEAKEGFAIASLVPAANRIEIEVATNLVGDNAPTADASQLLGSLPGGSFAAFAATDFGASLSQAIDTIDQEGIDGEIEPNEFKDALKANGIDLDKLTSGVGDLGVFAQGNTEQNLTGALVLTTKDAKEATNTVANIGMLMRASNAPGITALSGDAAGFSIRDPELGSQPLVVAAKGDKIAISYGLAASAQALSAGKGATLAENPTYKAAGEALGDVPLSGFVSGPATLALVGNMLSPEESAELDELRPFLDKVEYLAIGTGTSGDLATSKLVLGITK
jgi:hypothetical protein